LVFSLWSIYLARIRPSQQKSARARFESAVYSQLWAEVVNRSELIQQRRKSQMEAIGLLVTLEARAGREADAEAFLKSAQPLALDEKGTLKWYAFRLGPRKFGIFDTFANEAGRNAHLTGEIAKALGARASELFAVSPQVEKVEILASTPLKG
jgi:quinol monooxygenase YgiN